MRITEATRFPHPVLSPEGNDFTSGEFEVELDVTEKPATGALTFRYRILLTEPEITSFVTSGRAAVGCFVRCGDTYYSELRELGWPEGTSEFRPGSLRNRVTVRPLIWLKEDVANWSSSAIHPEFLPPVSLDRGSIIAISREYVISVGLQKFAPMESIFQLSESEDTPEGAVQINPDGDRIAILVGPALHRTIGILRGQQSGQSLLLNAVYLPAVMELLDMLRLDQAQYAGHRWFQPFMAKCDANGIDLSGRPSLFESAQKLLRHPARELELLAAEGDQ